MFNTNQDGQNGTETLIRKGCDNMNLEFALTLTTAIVIIALMKTWSAGQAGK